MCSLTACRVCTGCAHSQHDKCRGSVKCPTTGMLSFCTCCGDEWKSKPSANTHELIESEDA